MVVVKKLEIRHITHRQIRHASVDQPDIIKDAMTTQGLLPLVCCFEFLSQIPTANIGA
jgi:hypothetical protein